MHLDPPTLDDRPIWDLWLGQYQLPIVLVADELGLFALLDESPSTREELVERLQLSPRSIEVLVGVLAASGFAVQQLGRFQLTPVARTYLLEDSPFYWIPMLREVGFGQDIATEMLQRLRTDNLQPDDRISRRWERGELTLEDARASNRRMHSHSFPAALGVARHGDFQGVRRLLDVGGGSGCFSIALAMRYPDLRCTVAELPAVVPDTRAYIQRWGCEARVDTLELNMFETAWPGGYDAIFFSNIFHDWDARRRAELAARSFAALPPGGRVYLHEMLLRETRDGPLPATLFSAMMLGTRGKQYSANELAELLDHAGFADIRVTPTFSYHSLVRATRPA